MKTRSAVRRFLLAFVCILFLSGCANHDPASQLDEPKGVAHVAKTPDGFKTIVENNLFKDITAFDGRLLKAEICSVDEETKTVVQQIRMMDLYGKDLAVYTCSADDVITLTATDDGGFLFVLGFQDDYASRVIKCDLYGNLQFDTPFDEAEEPVLKYCFEKSGQFYLFGTRETPETKSTTDIYMVVLDKTGKILKTQYIAGSDFDDLHAVELSGDCFVLSISSQSDDGDFVGSNSNGHPVDWVVTVDEKLEIIEKKKESGRDYFDYRIGEKDGVPVYKSSALLNDFDAGRPNVFIDYGDFYLIVSENNTGIYENKPPAISAVWYYTETVYSAYDYSGKLIFRTSVDSSPDYDAWVKEFAVNP